MTKKKEQKTQKNTSNKVKEDLSDSSEIEDLKSQLEEAQQSAKDNWISCCALKLKWKI